MRQSLLISAASLCLAAGAAFAQPAPSPGPFVPMGPAVGGPPSEALPGTNATRPMHAQMRHNGPRHAGMNRMAATADDTSAPPTSAYRGGAGSPSSTQASNINGASRRSEIAPRLPDPNAANNSPEALLAAAQRALNQGHTGAAQEALERAETRILSRTTEPSMAGQPDSSAMAMHIAQARRALGNRDMAGAKAEVGMAISAPVPATGPAVTMTPGAMPMMSPPRTY